MNAIESVNLTLLDGLKKIKYDFSKLPTGLARKNMLKEVIANATRNEAFLVRQNLTSYCIYLLDEEGLTIDDFIKYLETFNKARADLNEYKNDFDEKYGTQTDVIWDQFLLPDSLSAERLATSAPYVPSPIAGVEEGLDVLSRLGVMYEDYIFIDVGAGLGRNMLLASERPFKQVQGIEISNHLCQLASTNFKIYRSTTQKCKNIKIHCLDALEYVFPNSNLVLYFYWPFEPELQERFMAKVKRFQEQSGVDIVLIFLGDVFPSVQESSSCILLKSIGNSTSANSVSKFPVRIFRMKNI